MKHRRIWMAVAVGAVIAIASIAYVATRCPISVKQDSQNTEKPAVGKTIAQFQERAESTKPPTLTKPSMQTVSVKEQVLNAKTAMSRKAFDKARESLSAAFAATTDPDERMATGQLLYECLIRTQTYDDALTLGRELLTLSPSPEERLVLNQQLAALLHRMGKSAEAEALVTQAMSQEHDAATQAKYEAQLRSIWRHTPGRTGEVVSNFTNRLAANPRDEAALWQLGDIYLKSRRDHKAAQPVYEQLAALHPEDPQIQVVLLGIYRETENFDGMRRVYENRLAQSGSNDPTVRFQIAQTELQAGRGDEAIAYAEKHLSGESATPFQLQMLSAVYNKAGRKDDAMATLDTAIVRETNAQQQVSMQFQKTEMLIWNKRYDEAEKLLRLIIQAAGDNKQIESRAKGEIVRIYEIQGRISELNL